MPTATQETKAAAKSAIKAIEAVEAPDSGIPEGKKLEELVAQKFVEVLTEPLPDYTGPNMRTDHTYIPEYVKTDDGRERRITKKVKVMGHVRTMTLDGLNFVRWCHPAKFDEHRRKGFDFINYRDFFGEGVTGYFQETPEHRIRNGDVYLMKISVDGLARMLREKLELQKHFESVHEGDMARAAEEYNTKAVRVNPDGTTENIN